MRLESLYKKIMRSNSRQFNVEGWDLENKINLKIGSKGKEKKKLKE